MFALLKLPDAKCGELWFQQDGETSQTAASMALLCERFQGGDINWPPRSPDLTATVFFTEIFKGTGLCFQNTKCPRAKGTISATLKETYVSLLERAINVFTARVAI